MATEMGAIILLFPPSRPVLDHFDKLGTPYEAAYADPDAAYGRVVEIDLAGLVPLISRPGHPEDVVAVREVAGTKIDSAFIGSCTNGRFEDLAAAAAVLKGRRVAPGVVLKIVPATRRGLAARARRRPHRPLPRGRGARRQPRLRRLRRGADRPERPGRSDRQHGQPELRRQAGQGRGLPGLAGRPPRPPPWPASIVTAADIPAKPVLFAGGKASAAAGRGRARESRDRRRGRPSSAAGSGSSTRTTSTRT